MTDIAVAHDHYYTWGGGEAVATELARCFETDIWTAFAEKDPLQYIPDGIEVHEVISGNPLEGFFRRISDSGWKRQLFYMFIWENVRDLREYDVIVQSGNNPNWYVPGDDQVIVKYTHSPPRQAYDLFPEKASTLEKHPIRHPLHGIGVTFDRGMKKATRFLWQETTSYPAIWVANSELVARRIHKYLGIPWSKITVVYPPVDVASYEPVAEPDDYYLTLSRLTHHKRIDQIIDAFHELNRHGDHHLKIAGTGPDGGELRERAGDAEYIEFVGFVDEAEKRQLFANARASIFAAENEDFGIVPIESMAAGCPVLGVHDGFTEYQVLDGKNGLGWDRSVADLVETVETFEAEGVAWSRRRIHEFSRQFGHDRFYSEMREVVDRAVDDHAIETKITAPEVTPRVAVD